MNKVTICDQGKLIQLYQLELTLLAVRLPFLKIYKAHRGKQNFVHENMMIVPADVENTVKKLPILTYYTLCIKHHIYCLNIRPQLVKRSS